MCKTNTQSAADLHSTDPLTLLLPSRKFSRYTAVCSAAGTPVQDRGERGLVIFEYGNVSMFVIKWIR
jgi:hypothetical protein